jgi:outer membrane receptor for ferrienterochelin and colicins
VTDLPEVNERLTLRASETLELGGGSRLDFSFGQSLFAGRSERDRRESPVDQWRRRRAALSSVESVATLADGERRTWVVGLRTESERFSERVRRMVVVGDGLEARSADEVSPTMLSSAATFAQLGWEVLDEVSLMPGARGEIHDRYGAVLSPRLAVAVRPSETLTFRVAAGRGFRAPSAKEYGFAFDHSVIGYRVLGNPELVPETSWGATSDVTFRPGPRFRLRAGGFGNWVEHLIAFEPAGVQTDPNVTDYRYVNVARARTAGADAAARFTPVEGLSATAGYSYLFTRDDTSGEPLPNRPPHTLTLSALARLPAGLELSVRYRYVTEADAGEGVRTEAHGLLDARVAYVPVEALQVYAGGANLLDVRRDPGRVGDARPTLGMALYVGARAELSFDDDAGEEE